MFHNCPSFHMLQERGEGSRCAIQHAEEPSGPDQGKLTCCWTHGSAGEARLKSNIPPQSHPDAWPFMEPVKKTEAPDYYEIIRFPIGQ